jgi:deazaflavin-dependent oxidoreductase (nitroreductase family)
MRETFHMTSSMRIGSTMLTALLRAGLPLGSLTLLSVRGRKSGKISTIPVALVEQDGTSFLVAAFGEVSWVRNLRVTGQAQLTRRRRTEAIGVVELEAREAAPILKQFLTSYQRVPFIPPYFDVTPRSPLVDFEREATQHPVFRIERSEQDAGKEEARTPTHPGR